MKCHIISIGNELLIGDTINTNASWIGTFLTQHEVEVASVLTVGDNLEVIKEAIQRSMSQADLVITTGGLGPTHDDVTKRAVQEIFGAELVVHQQTLDFIQDVFRKRNLPFSKSNYQQAEVPANCEVLFNRQGTAPGMWIEEGGSRLVVLPGVPFEMKKLMEEYVLPKIEAATGGVGKLYSRYILTAGIGESTLSDDVLQNVDEFLDENVSLAYLPGLQGVQIRISGRGDSSEEVQNRVGPVVDYIYSRAGDVIVGEGKELTLSEALGNVLRAHKLTIAVAESCTGGMVANELTNVAGSSDYMIGGVVAYANDVKKKLLGVSEKDLSSYGAVSKQVALQMARGVAQRMKTEIGISTTGVAGPGGGTSEKPVGTVWIGYWSPDRHFAIKTLFTNNRIVNKERSVAVALETVRRCVKGIETMPYSLKPHIA